MPDQDRVTSVSFRSELATGCDIIAISFSDDEETNILAWNVEASLLLEKINLGTELIPAIKKIVS